MAWTADPLKLWVGNVPHGCPAYALQQEFESFGCAGIAQVHVFNRGSAAEQKDSSAFVTFETHEAAAAGLICHGHTPRQWQKALVVRWANAKQMPDHWQVGGEVIPAKAHPVHVPAKAQPLQPKPPSFPPPSARSDKPPPFPPPSARDDAPWRRIFVYAQFCYMFTKIDGYIHIYRYR